MAGKVVPVNGYSTHQQALVKYVSMASKGDLIVELGCGFYSTPLIDSIALINGLKFKCYFQEIAWQKTVEPLCPNTEFIHVQNWNRWKLEEECFLSMLDNEELCVNRYKQIDRSLFKQSKYILMHDADIYPKRGLPIREEFEMEYFDKLIPNTCVIDTSVPKKVPKKKENAPDVKNHQEDLEKDLEKDLEVKKKKRKCFEVEAEHTNVVTQFSNLPEPEVGKLTGLETISQFSNVNNVVEDTFAETHSSDIKTAIVCCFTAGGDYDSHCLEYIQRLADGVEQNNTRGEKLHCVTIMNLDVIPNVKKIQPVKDNWKGWHIKAEVFRTALWEGYDRVLYIDLDTVITGDLDEMLTSTSRFSMLHDFYHPKVQETGMLYFDPKITNSLYERFTKRQPHVKVKDADIVNKWLRVNKIAPKILQKHYPIGSYKVSLIRDRKDIEDYSIICFHGNPRPHHVGWNVSVDADTPMSNHAKKLLNRQAKGQVVQPVERKWEGEDVFVIGGGPSLLNVDLDEYLADKNVVGINDGYLYDCCDVCYFGDTVWWNHHNDGIKQFQGEIYTTSGVKDPTIHHLDVIGVGFSDDPTKLAWNSNSGMAGVNLAALFGAKRIFLLGFDMSFGAEGESNWHDNIRKVNSNTYKCFLGKELSMRKGMDNLFPDLEVFNVETIEDVSKMVQFPKVPFNELFIETS